MKGPGCQEAEMSVQAFDNIMNYVKWRPLFLCGYTPMNILYVRRILCKGTSKN